MKRLMYAILAAFIAAGAASTAAAATFYVQAGVGDDANEGLGWGPGNALATVGAALTKAGLSGEADVINVAAGTYTERISLVSDVTLLGGYPAGGGASRDPAANETVIDGASGGSTVEIMSRDNCVLDGFTITGGSRATGCGGGISVANGSGLVISGNVIEGNAFTGSVDGGGAGVCLDSAVGAVVRGNRLQNNLSGFDGGGLYVHYATDAVIEDNVFYGNFASNWGGGINLYHSSAAVTNNAILSNISTGPGAGISLYDFSTMPAFNNTIAGNISTDSPEGGGVYNQDSAAAIINCIVWNNAPDQLFAAAGSPIEVSYSDVEGGWAGTGNISGDPRFSGADAFIPLLEGSSPCVNAGTSEGAPERDIRNIHRPWGAAVDMGACEMVLWQPQLPLLLMN